ncbi:MAG: efflux RND transporter periplasmic adaptor subunit [Betaproteobacteria bacterium]|nr:efflux RND transporter periplasmic adaptor subunit [Betaproteobacteria bacterium]
MKGSIRQAAIFFCLSAAAASLAVAGQGVTALVETTLIAHERFPVTVHAYGEVMPGVGRTVHLSIPRAGRVSQVRVTLGEVVRQGEPLLDFTTAPASEAAYRQAVAAVAFATDELARKKQLLGEKMATRSDVAMARRALSDARSTLRAQEKIGAGRGRTTLRAPFSGVITALAVKSGDRVQASSVLMQIARDGALLATLGVDPEEARKVRPGAPVEIVSSFDSRQRLEARIDTIHGVIDPQTRLVDCTAQLPAQDGFLPGTPVHAIITVSRRPAWVVPRSAVLRDLQGAYIFQVAHGRAHRVDVKTGFETDAQTAITGAFDPRLPVVIVGNYELTDGMRVRERAR